MYKFISIFCLGAFTLFILWCNNMMIKDLVFKLFEEHEEYDEKIREVNEEYDEKIREVHKHQILRLAKEEARKCVAEMLAKEKGKHKKKKR